jgi:hypothetical protein
MKHLHTFESFLNEAAQGTEVQETADIKINYYSNSLTMQWSPDYNMTSLFTLLKSFKKPNIKSIVIDIPKIATITADASGITTVPLSSKLKKMIQRAESANPGTKYFSNQEGNVWYNLTKAEALLNSKIKSVLRLEFMDSIKWPIEVPTAEGSQRNEKWFRERPVFDPTEDDDDFALWLSQLPQIPIKPGLAQGTKETQAVIQKVVDLSPKTLTVTVTGAK